MKALPLWQPWATLVAIGAKRVETRAFSPGKFGLVPGQRIAIHATKTVDQLHICEVTPFADYIPDPLALPLGAIVATCTLERASQITAESAQALRDRNPTEHHFGDYTPGRWAWVLADVVALPSPLPFKGSQGTFDVPDHLLGRPEAAAPPPYRQEVLL